MIFETHSLRAPFDGLIESIFHYKGFQPDHSIERVVPTGHVFVIFELDGIERHTYDNDTLQVIENFRGSWVSGIHRNYISISAHQDSEMFVIQFKAFGAHPFLRQPMDQLADKVTPGNNLLGGSFPEFRERLLAAPTSADKFALTDAWLESNYDVELITPEPIINVVKGLQAQPASKLNEIICQYTGTQKHLISQFRKYIGITPKHYQRVLRFNDVFVQMQNDQFLSWSDIAHRCGYSDQSHFIREFKNYSGFNPESYLREDFDDDASNFFPLDRGG